MILLLIILAAVKVDEALFPKHKNIFKRTITHELREAEIPEGFTDFLQSVIQFLEASNEGGDVAPEKLNKFSDGLKQYYLSKAYEHYFTKKVQPSASNESFSDPVCMPNATVDDVEFFRVKIYGFPAFNKNTRVSNDIDSSPYVKNYSTHFNATSDVFIINGNFKILGEQFYFVYNSFNNIYIRLTDTIRTNYGLLKPRLTAQNFFVGKDDFVHTYDSVQEHHADVNSTIYPKFQKVFRDTYMPLLASFVEEVTRPLQLEGDVQFIKVYRQKVVETLIESANQYLRRSGHLSHEFTPQKVRNTRPGNTTFYTYKSKMDGYLNYEKYDLNSSQIEGDESTSFMYDVISFLYPEEGEKTSSFVIAAETLEKNELVYSRKFGIKSIEIMIAYKADFSSFPINVYRDLERWKFTKTGFYSKIELYNFDPFYHFAVQHVQVESAKLIGSILDAKK